MTVRHAKRRWKKIVRDDFVDFEKLYAYGAHHLVTATLEHAAKSAGG